MLRSGCLQVRGVLLPIALRLEETTRPWRDGAYILELWLPGVRHGGVESVVPRDWLSFDCKLGGDLETENVVLESAQLLLATCQIYTTEDEKDIGWPLCDSAFPWLGVSGILVIPRVTDGQGGTPASTTVERIGTLRYGWRCDPSVFAGESNYSPRGVGKINYIDAWGGLNVGSTVFNLV